MNGKINMKVLAAAASLAMALVLMVTGTFAWFDLQPSKTIELGGGGEGFTSNEFEEVWPFEVSLDYGTLGEGANWYKEVSITDALGTNLDDFLLRPISTADLQHWYVATYDAYDNVDGFREVDLDKVSNKHNPFPDDGDYEYTENCVAYVDMWIRTKREGSYDLRLNNPMYMANGQLHVGADEVNFGTFVLSNPIWTVDHYEVDNAAMACARVGFLAYDENEQPENAYILEPNADMHEGLGNPNAAEEQIYLGNTGNGEAVGDYDLHDGEFVMTLVPEYRPGSEKGYVLTGQQTVWQTSSSWDPAMLNVHAVPWTSRYIGVLGQFVDNLGMEYNSYTSMPPIAEDISKDHIKHVRVFFWLEGQDAECWNIAAGGNLYVNLELRGDDSWGYYGGGDIDPYPIIDVN